MANVTVTWRFNNRDEVVVTDAISTQEAWDAAETFLQDFSEKDKTTDYSTGLPGAEGIEETENGEYYFTVKAYDKVYSFAQALSAHLESRGLTQKELATMIGVTEGMVSQYIAGHRKPGLDLIQRIADALESKLDYTPGVGWGLTY